MANENEKIQESKLKDIVKEHLENEEVISAPELLKQHQRKTVMY